MAIVLSVATAFEGLICIIMLLPLAIPVVMLGVLVGSFLVGLGPWSTLAISASSLWSWLPCCRRW